VDVDEAGVGKNAGEFIGGERIPAVVGAKMVVD